MSLFIRRLWLAAAVAFLPTSASAHGFGQRYDLPVPLGLFMLGAGASVVLSFLGMGLFVRKKQESVDYPSYNLLASPLFGWMGSKVFLLLIRVLSIFMFCGGLLGNGKPG